MLRAICFLFRNTFHRARVLGPAEPGSTFTGSHERDSLGSFSPGASRILECRPLWELLMPFAPAASRILLLAPLLLVLAAVRCAEARPQSGDSSATSVPILVSDFELFSVAPPPNSPRTPAAPAQSQQTKKAAPTSVEPEVPAVQARRLSGYTTRRARGATLPKGAWLRGVFAEPDEKNCIRRTLLGGASVNPKFFLYVGIFNLARPDQPLYQLAAGQPGGSQFGPVITLNNYIPLAKYELDKNPTEEDVRKVSTQIAASLTALLAANPGAFAQ